LEPKATLCLSTLRSAKRGNGAAEEILGKSLIAWARQALRAYRTLEPDELAGSFAAQVCRNQCALLPDDDLGQLEAYLYRALRNFALNELRSARRRNWQTHFAAAEDEDMIADTRAVNPEVILLGKESLRHLLVASQRLSLENRQLLLALAGGASHQELAVRFALKPGTLAKRLWSVRQQIRRTLDNADQQEKVFCGG
jgi:DNA-directed RNA polymerase specialized sigma24 family protein